MWTNEGTLIRPGLALALPVSSAGGMGWRTQGLQRQCHVPGVTGSPGPCPGLLLGDLSEG